MTTDGQPPTVDERLLEEASEWVARLDRGLLESERAALDAFLANAEARALFLRLAALSDRLNELSALSPGAEPARAARAVPRRSGFGAVALAATLLLAVAVAWRYHPGPSIMPPDASTQLNPVAYETRVGEQSVFKLPDGTAVSLNTDSRVSTAFSDRGRLAILDRGEAHFEVTPDPYRPFTVLAGDHLVQVVGTSFSVYRTEDDAMEVVVSEGSVRILDAGPLAAPASSARNESLDPPTLLPGGKTLSAGDAAVFSSPEQAPRISRLDAAEMTARLAWREGNLVFRGETLAQALAEISRYTPMRFEFLDQRAKAISVAGVFRSGDVEGLLRTLEANFDIAYQRIDDEVVLITSR